MQLSLKMYDVYSINETPYDHFLRLWTKAGVATNAMHQQLHF